jgi:hypothetical protein
MTDVEWAVRALSAELNHRLTPDPTDLFDGDVEDSSGEVLLSLSGTHGAEASRR